MKKNFYEFFNSWKFNIFFSFFASRIKYKKVVVTITILSDKERVLRLVKVNIVAYTILFESKEDQQKFVMIGLPFAWLASELLLLPKFKLWFGLDNRGADFLVILSMFICLGAFSSSMTLVLDELFMLLIL